MYINIHVYIKQLTFLYCFEFVVVFGPKEKNGQLTNLPLLVANSLYFYFVGTSIYYIARYIHYMYFTHTHTHTTNYAASSSKSLLI